MVLLPCPLFPFSTLEATVAPPHALRGQYGRIRYRCALPGAVCPCQTPHMATCTYQHTAAQGRRPLQHMAATPACTAGSGCLPACPTHRCLCGASAASSAAAGTGATYDDHPNSQAA
eukprot:1158009-Pelagomonas_calceolata.AAC.5